MTHNTPQPPYTEPDCDDARADDYCTTGVIRHLRPVKWAAPLWLCLRHKQERDEAGK